MVEVGPSDMEREEVDLHRRDLLFGTIAAGITGTSIALLPPQAMAEGKAPSSPVPSTPQDNLCSLDWFAHSGGDADLATADPLTPTWRLVNLGIGWERQNMRIAGTTWLRKDFTLPLRLEGRTIRLDVKMAAAAVELWCNGRLVGENRDANQLMSFDLSVDLLKGGRPNQLALRVIDHIWTGGINEDVVRLVADGADSVLVVKEVVAPDNYVFPNGSGAEFGVSLETANGPARNVRLSVEVLSEFHATIYTGDAHVTLEGGSSLLRFDLGRLQPGFYQVVLRYSHGDRYGQRVFWFGVAPTLIAPMPHPPADFEDYWARAKRELAQVRPHFNMVLDAERSTQRHRVYSVEMASFDNVTVRAWYIVPVKPGRYPAVLNVPGYSVAQDPQRYQTDDDIVYLALDVRGQGRSRDVVNPGFGIPGLLGYRIDDPEHYVYKAMYLDCGRALEFLTSRPEIDHARVAVCGGSQGGGLAFASAALFPQMVKICVAASPYLGDFSAHMHIRDIYRGEMQSHVDHVPGVTWETIYRSMNLIDTVNLAPRIRCPVLMGTGLFDDDCPPRIGFAVFNNIQSSKNYRVYPHRGHMLWNEWERDSTTWLRQQLRL